MSSKKTHASVAKLVDATDLKSVDRNIMLVQVRPEVPSITTPISGVVFYSFSNICVVSKVVVWKIAKFSNLSNLQILFLNKLIS